MNTTGLWFGGIIGISLSQAGVCLSEGARKPAIFFFIICGLAIIGMVLHILWIGKRIRTQVRLRLDQEAFRTLVSGGTVKAGPLEIILADIGYDNMIDEIHESMWKPKE